MALDTTAVRPGCLHSSYCICLVRQSRQTLATAGAPPTNPSKHRTSAPTHLTSTTLRTIFRPEGRLRTTVGACLIVALCLCLWRATTNSYKEMVENSVDGIESGAAFKTRALGLFLGTIGPIPAYLLLLTSSSRLTSPAAKRSAACVFFAHFVCMGVLVTQYQNRVLYYFFNIDSWAVKFIIRIVGELDVHTQLDSPTQLVSPTNTTTINV